MKIKKRILRKHIRQIYIGEYSTLSIWEVLNSKFISYDLAEGKYIPKFEEAFKARLGTKYAISFGKARMALYAILKAFNIKDGDEVLIPAYTCLVVPNAIIYNKSVPIYVDINKETFNIDVRDIEKKITKRTRAILLQHTFGQPVEIDKILTIAKKNNLYVIEDCAHSLGARYKGKEVGTFGDVSFFSFEKTKVLTTNIGGMAATNSEEIYKDLKKLQEKTPYPSKNLIKSLLYELNKTIYLHPSFYFIGEVLSLISNKIKPFPDSISPEEYHSKQPKDYPFRFTNALAKIGISQLKKLDKINERRKQIASIYNREFKKIGIETPKIMKGSESIYLRYPLLVENRDKVKETFEKNQIILGEWFKSPIHPKTEKLEETYYKKGSCPIAEEVSSKIINLPTHPKMSDRDVRRVINTVYTYKNLFK